MIYRRSAVSTKLCDAGKLGAEQCHVAKGFIYSTVQKVANKSEFLTVDPPVGSREFGDRTATVCGKDLALKMLR